MSTPTALFGDGDVLLYIGISGEFGRRWHRHSKTKPWWTEGRRATLEWHATREDARAAEEAAIKGEHPKHNMVHNRPVLTGYHVAGIGLTDTEQGRLPVTLDIAEAGKVIGINRVRARELAKAGQFPCRVLPVGVQYRVPTFVLLNTPGLAFSKGALRALIIPAAA